jgi:predicted transcriptional regulator
MTPKLSEPQREALRDRQGGVLPVVDDETKKRYVIVEEDLHARAMRALQAQEDIDAIQAGIKDMEAGRFVSLQETDAEIRKALRFHPQR